MKSSKKEVLLFVIVMLVFVIGMIVLIAYQITNWLVWIFYLIIWTVVEVKVAKNIHLKWWVWVAIFIGLSILDYIIVQYFN